MNDELHIPYMVLAWFQKKLVHNKSIILFIIRFFNTVEYKTLTFKTNINIVLINLIEEGEYYEETSKDGY